MLLEERYQSQHFVMAVRPGRIHSGWSLYVQAPKSEYVPFPHYQRVMKAKRAKEKRLAEEVRNASCFVLLQFPLPSKLQPSDVASFPSLKSCEV